MVFCTCTPAHHTFTPIIKQLITTTANKHPGKKSFIDKNMNNPTGIKLCISPKIATVTESRVSLARPPTCLLCHHFIVQQIPDVADDGVCHEP